MSEPLSYAVEALTAGASLSNLSICATADARSNLAALYTPSDNAYPVERIEFRFSLIGPGIERLEPLVTQFYPAYQETIWGTEGLVLTQRIFVPYEVAYERAVCWLIEVQAEGPRVLQVEIDIHFAEDLTPQPPSLPGKGEPEGSGERSRRMRLQDGLFVAVEPVTRVDAPRQVCVFGSSGPPSYTDLTDPTIARLVYHVLIEGEVEQPFVLTTSEAGESLAWNAFLMLSDTEQVFRNTVRAFDTRLSAARVTTPDAGINRTLEWAKVNALRVQQRYRWGYAVPARLPGDTLNIHTAARYALGASWLSPDFVGRMLDFLARCAFTEGQMAAVVHAASLTCAPDPSGASGAWFAQALDAFSRIARPPGEDASPARIPPPGAAASRDPMASLRQAAAWLNTEQPVAHEGYVPGQFPHLDSASAARGRAALDPVVGPTLLRLALEEGLGLTPSADGLTVTPRLPADWTWIAATDIPYQGQKVSIALLNGVLYTTVDVTAPLPVEVFDRADIIPGEVCAILFQRLGARVLFAASDVATATFIRVAGRTVPVQLGAGEAVILSV